VIYLLDSNTCIGWLRLSQPKVVDRIKIEPAGNIVICSVVVGELIYGAERAGAAHQANNRRLPKGQEPLFLAPDTLFGVTDIQ
jgi:predicted nucleic acid-binding protein